MFFCFFFQPVIPLDGSQPVRYCLKLELDAKYRLLKEQLIELCNINRLFLVDVFGGTVRVRKERERESGLIESFFFFSLSLSLSDFS